MRLHCVAALVLAVAFGTPLISAQRSDTRSDTLDALESAVTELATLSDELLDYQRALPSDLDRDIAGDLWDISDLASLYVHATQTNVTLMGLMQNAEQRQLAQGIIGPYIEYYVGRLDEHIRLSNTLVANSSSPAVVAAGNRLVAQLRSTKALLQTISG